MSYESWIISILVELKNFKTLEHSLVRIISYRFLCTTLTLLLHVDGALTSSSDKAHAGDHPSPLEVHSLWMKLQKFMAII